MIRIILLSLFCLTSALIFCLVTALLALAVELPAWTIALAGVAGGGVGQWVFDLSCIFED